MTRAKSQQHETHCPQCNELYSITESGLACANGHGRLLLKSNHPLLYEEVQRIRREQRETAEAAKQGADDDLSDHPLAERVRGTDFYTIADREGLFRIVRKKYRSSLVSGEIAVLNSRLCEFARATGAEKSLAAVLAAIQPKEGEKHVRQKVRGH
jgi:hypothetical protein